MKLGVFSPALADKSLDDALTGNRRISGHGSL